MQPLILHPTDLSQWYTIVNEAQAHTNIVLSEDTESYLVFLLLRFSHNPNFSDSTIGLDFLNAMHTSGKLQIERLKEVGDKSLIFAGMFPELAQKRRVSLDYFVDVGKSAYLIVSSLELPESKELYYELGNKFISLKKILNAVAHINAL